MNALTKSSVINSSRTDKPFPFIFIPFFTLISFLLERSVIRCASTKCVSCWKYEEEYLINKMASLKLTELFSFAWAYTNSRLVDYYRHYFSEVVTVTTKSGPVKGFKIASTFDYQYMNFVGIPYAKPPVGELRFKVCTLLLVFFSKCVLFTLVWLKKCLRMIKKSSHFSCFIVIYHCEKKTCRIRSLWNRPTK